MDTSHPYSRRADEALETHGKRLLMPSGHLSHSEISLYINFHTTLSVRERTNTEDHLASCYSCRAVFEEVFDSELEFDPAARDVQVPLDHDGFFRSEGWVIRFRSDGDHGLVIFETVPQSHVGQKARLAIDGNILRLLTVDAGLSIPVVYPQTVQTVTLRSVPAPAESRGIQWLGAPVIRYLAAAVVLILLGALLYPFLREQGQEKVTENPAAPAKGNEQPIVSKPAEERQDKPERPKPRSSPGVLMADRFAENETLESFIGRQYRSELSVEIRSPQTGTVVTVPFQLAWTASAPQALNIVVVDNQNHQVWQKNDVTEFTELNEPLRPGLYYWMLKTNGATHAVGKFIIR